MRKVGWLRYLVKIECALPYKVPGGHVAGVRSNLKSMAQQQFGLDRRCDPLGDGVLHRKYLDHRKIVMFGPDDGALHCVGEVHRYPHPIAGTPDGSIHQKIDAKFVRDRLRIPRAIPPCETRPTRRDAEPSEPSERHDQVVGDTVGQILSLGIAAEILERQYCNPGAVSRLRMPSATGSVGPALHRTGKSVSDPWDGDDPVAAV